METSEVNLVVGDEPRGTSLGRVAIDHFGTLGAIPRYGRSFVPGEDDSRGDQVVVPSHRLWRERFAGDVAVPGRGVRLGGDLCRIVGVHPPKKTPAWKS